MCKVQSHELVTGVKHGKEHSRIGLRTRVWLNIHPLGIIKLFQALTCDVLNDVNHLATAVIALAWIALGILVCKH